MKHFNVFFELDGESFKREVIAEDPQEASNVVRKSLLGCRIKKVKLKK